MGKDAILLFSRVVPFPMNVHQFAYLFELHAGVSLKTLITTSFCDMEGFPTKRCMLFQKGWTSLRIIKQKAATLISASVSARGKELSQK